MTSSKKPSPKSIERFEGEGGTTRAGELARKQQLEGREQPSENRPKATTS